MANFSPQRVKGLYCFVPKSFCRPFVPSMQRGQGLRFTSCSLPRTPPVVGRLHTPGPPSPRTDCRRLAFKDVVSLTTTKQSVHWDEC